MYADSPLGEVAESLCSAPRFAAVEPWAKGDWATTMCGNAGVRSGVVVRHLDPECVKRGSFVAWIRERLREITPWVRVLPDTQKTGRRARLTR
jgi:hypothetical protein